VAATTRTPVLIAGAGPAGLVTALGLARQGVRSMIVERHAGTSIYPRATGVSLRSMEIFRALGVEAEIRAHSLDARPTMSLAESLASAEHVEAPLGFPTEAQADAVSPTRPAISPQDHVEPVLVRALRAAGLTELQFNTELVGMSQDAAGVRATVVDRMSGEQSVVAARYLVGADGGRSTVRDLLGIEAVGPTDLEQYATVLFRAPLWPVLGDRRHALYLVGPERRSVIVPMGLDDRWMFATPTDRATAESIAADEARSIALVREATGVPDLDVEVIASMPITFVAQVASRWRDGNVFLIGDAAHRMPPFGGRGMNTAIADAHNLAWKLAWVIQDVADRRLLDSFEAERGPVGRRNVELALARYGGDAEAAQPSPDGLAEDMGYVYGSGAIAGDAGTRAPHAWLRHDGGRVSTVDLFGDRLVLLANGAGGAWRMAVNALRGTGYVLAGLAALGPAMPIFPPPPLSVIPVGGALVDRDGSFAKAYGLEPGGAVLVRPDGHIAARWTSAPVDHRSALVDAVAVALGQAVAKAPSELAMPPVTQPEARRVPTGWRTADPSPA
jgi:2-polyprenyl-6-methoxyphenol hydroxylase-like FAD-dependent oxidoreductase